MKKYLLVNFALGLSLVLGSSYSLRAQFAESIASGRPGNANGTNSVGKGVYQAQIGYNFINSSLSGSDLKGILPNDRLFQGADGMFRIGLREDNELRISTNIFSMDRRNFENDESIDQSGLENFTIGFRQTLTQQQGFWPGFCIQFIIDFGGIGQYKSNNPDPILRLNFVNQLSDNLTISYNVANRWNVDESNLSGFYIVNLAYGLSDKFSLAAEGFGFIREESNAMNGGLGLAYLVNNDFQLDLYGSYGKNYFKGYQSEQALLSLTAGISYRIVNR